MQIKKEEMREKILQAAIDEFFKKGYENASMRVIAQKSYTTVGNIYHYFENKDVLLEAILLPVIEDLETKLARHEEEEQKQPMTKQQALDFIDNMEENMEHSDLKCLLDKRVVILFKLESSSLLERKERLLKSCKEHLNEHLNAGGNERYSEILVNMFVDWAKNILTRYEDIDEAKAEFVKLFKMFCSGIIGQRN